jgi:hypothetical protein
MQRIELLFAQRACTLRVEVSPKNDERKARASIVGSGG